MDIIQVGKEASPPYASDCILKTSQTVLSTVPEQLRLKEAIPNPALPPRRSAAVPTPAPYITETRGTGSKRIYLDIQSAPENVAYPPRPVPGSVADLDVVMDHCDFSEKKVRIFRESIVLRLLFSLVCAGLFGGIAGRRRFG